MKNNLRYTKLPNRKLPKFQQPLGSGQPGEIQYDEYGNVLNVPYLTGADFFDNIFSTKQKSDNSFLSPLSPNIDFTRAQKRDMRNTRTPNLDYKQISQAQSLTPCPPGYTREKNGSCQPMMMMAPKTLEENKGKAQELDTKFGNELIANLKPFEFAERRKAKKFFKDYNQEYGTDLKLPSFGDNFKSLDDLTPQQVAMGAGAGLLMTDAVLQAAYNRKRVNDFYDNARDNNFTQASSPGFRGNTNFNTGEFQQNIRIPNEGRTVEIGGQINDTMKIRITGVPTEQMAYGGQANGYGLDLNQKRVQVKGNPTAYDTVSNSIGAVPREEANIEAEGGETVYGDLDGDGGLEHMVIKGKRHTEGGVPLNVPGSDPKRKKPGSFIFSDTKSMKIKDPAILAKFGASLKKGGMTPASIAKKYDVNTYKAIMEDPNADPLAKATAQLMVSNYQKKLGELAYVQEGMKGFPGGIPDVAQSVMPQAQFGGYLPTYQSDVASGQVTQAKKVDPRKVNSKEELDKLIKDGYTLREGTTDIWEKTTYDRKPEIPGSAGDGTSTYKGPAAKATQLTGDPCEYVAGLAKSGRYTKEDLFKVNPGVGRLVHPGAWESVKDCWEKNYTPKPGTQPKCPEGYESDPENQGQCRKANPDAVTWKPEDTPPPGEEVPVENPKYKSSWFKPDVFNLAGALYRPPQVRMPFSPDLDFRPNQYALKSWLGKAQAIQGVAGKSGETLSTYQPGTALASNLSYLQSQAADNITKAIDQTDTDNVATFNNYAQNEGNRKDIVSMYNAKNRAELSDKANEARKDMANSERAYVTGINDAYGRGFNNAMMGNLMNATNMYNVNPWTGDVVFKKGYTWEDMPQYAGASSGIADWNKMYEKYQQASAAFPGLTRSEFLGMGNRFSSVDTNGDGIADRTTTSGRRSNKVGGEIDKIIQYLRGGFVFDPHGY